LSDARRIGVFGGTFDPIHNTHLNLARAALLQAPLDKVLFVVSAQPPHKRTGVHLGAEDRYTLVCDALLGEPNMEASRMELDRSGPSYTADTVEELAASLPGAALFLILGMDAVRDLPKWRDPERILRHACILAAARPGQDTTIPELLDGKVRLLDFPEEAVSSTDIRDRVSRGESVAHLLPHAVLMRISSNDWYANG